MMIPARQQAVTKRAVTSHLPLISLSLSLSLYRLRLWRGDCVDSNSKDRQEHDDETGRFVGLLLSFLLRFFAQKQTSNV